MVFANEGQLSNVPSLASYDSMEFYYTENSGQFFFKWAITALPYVATCLHNLPNITSIFSMTVWTTVAEKMKPEKHMPIFQRIRRKKVKKCDL